MPSVECIFRHKELSGTFWQSAKRAFVIRLRSILLQCKCRYAVADIYYRHSGELILPAADITAPGMNSCVRRLNMRWGSKRTHCLTGARPSRRCRLLALIGKSMSRRLVLWGRFCARRRPVLANRNPPGERHYAVTDESISDRVTRPRAKNRPVSIEFVAISSIMIPPKS